MRGQKHSRAESCSRWPQQSECDQECLAQIDASPENLERLFASSFAGKHCAICARDITPNDWRQGRLALFNQDQQLVELRDLPAENLPGTLRDTSPLCWKCHQQEHQRQLVPLRMMRGNRVGLASLHDPV